MARRNPKKQEVDVPFDVDRLPDPNFRVPDLSQALEGWRVWSVSTDITPMPKMYSATKAGYYWTPRRVSMAYCARCGDDVPGEKCTCGFYSAKEFMHLMSMAYHKYDVESGHVMVLGQIANWGGVVTATQGWRAQFAYPVKLWVPFETWELAEPLEQTYGVPVSLHNYLKPREQTLIDY